jgi:REP element-mobilizing transposase RayT
VIARGNRKQGVFLDEKDFKQFLAYVVNCKNRFSFRLYAYALMQNHLHFLIEVGEVPLSRIMQSLLFAYASYFNRRYGEVGHLFQGRYKAILCDKDTYLLELVRYIHLNPVRASIAEGPEDYVWTGHLSYLGKGGRDLIDEGFVLDQFGASRSLARRRYRQFVGEGISGGHEEKYYQVKDQRYLGENGFIDRIEIEKERSESWTYDVPLEAISHEASRETGISEDKLYSVTRDREGALGRGIVAYLARVVSDYTVREIGDHFRRSPVAIGEAIMKVEDRVHRDRSFAKAIRRMKEKLIEGRKRKYRVSVA